MLIQQLCKRLPAFGNIQSLLCVRVYIFVIFQALARTLSFSPKIPLKSSALLGNQPPRWARDSAS